jgi:hypothetical protein
MTKAVIEVVAEASKQLAGETINPFREHQGEIISQTLMAYHVRRLARL